MFLFIAIVIIMLLSIVMALLSLKNIRKGLRTKETREALKKERVIFYSSKPS